MIQNHIIQLRTKKHHTMYKQDPRSDSHATMNNLVLTATCGKWGPRSSTGQNTQMDETGPGGWKVALHSCTRILQRSFTSLPKECDFADSANKLLYCFLRPQRRKHVSLDPSLHSSRVYFQLTTNSYSPLQR